MRLAEATRMNRSALLAAFVLVPCLAACGDDSSEATGGAGGQGPATSTTTGATPSTTGGADGGGGSSSSGSEGGGGNDGRCSPSEPCASADQFCLYTDRLCGEGEQDQGYCTDITEGDCTPTSQVCGCDGTVYESGCLAEQAHVDITDPAACDLPEGTFACGLDICQMATDYCATVSEIGVDAEECSSFSHCQPIPVCDGAPCDCVEADASDLEQVECTGDVDAGVRAEISRDGC